MSSLFDKLNLRPGERRLVVIVSLTVFVVLNAFLVWPKFFEWSKVKNREHAARTSYDQFKREVDRIPSYEKRLRELEQAGAAVGSEDQASKLQTTVYSQSALSGVQVNTYTAQQKTSAGGKTNQFFDEQSSVIQFIAEEKSLVDFLYNLGIGGSMIRVRQMTLNTDAPRQKLQGTITLVASFARRAPPKSAPGASPAVAAVPAPRPATAAPAPGSPQKSLTNAVKAASASSAPAQKQTSWLSRLWPFGKTAAAPPKTNAPAKTNAPPKK
jgi:hypothetical protein